MEKCCLLLCTDCFVSFNCTWTHICLISWLVDCLNSIHGIVLSTNINSLLHPFLLVCLLFLCYFISPIRVWTPMLNENCKVGHHFHLPDFRREDFSFSSLYIMLVVSLLYMECIPYYYYGLKWILSTPNLLSAFVIKH